MTKPRKQLDIYNLVKSRGYGPEAQGLDAYQFAARQIIKALEEIQEVIYQIRLRGKPINDRLKYLDPRDLFDDVEMWRRVNINNEIKFINELADAAVPLFCAAEALGIELVDLARDKAQRDVARGLRDNGS